jgi:L-fucose isomerase-like protein
LVPRLPAAKSTRIVIVGCGVKIHFPWDKACARLTEASRVLEVASATTGLPVEIVTAPEPYEDPNRLLAFLDGELARGIGGVVFFHAAYTAGEIGSVLGRWLLDHRTPVLSWAWPEPGTGGANEANSLTCQNFILNMWKQLGVSYAWLHEEINAAAAPVLERFVRVTHARARLRNGKLLHAGGSRVTAFYDGEVDELAVMQGNA